jgi:hypothetical protein
MRHRFLHHLYVCVFLVSLSVSASESGELEVVSEGLELRLESSTTSVAFGEEFNLKTTVRHRGKGTVRCHVGWWDRRHFYSKITFRARYIHPVGAGDAVPGAEFVGHCATGRIQEIVNLTRRRSHIVSAHGRFDRWFKDRLHVRIDDHGFEVDPPCTIGIRAVLRVSPSLYRDRVSGAAKVSGTVWAGETESNEVILHILPAGLDGEWSGRN